MTIQGQRLLVAALVDELAPSLEHAPAGHCARLDDVSPEIADRLRDELAARVPDVAVHTLRVHPQQPHDVKPENAVEIRNRKASACFLIVPSGEGHSASSLDNAFERTPIVDVYKRAAATLRKDLASTPLGEPLRRFVSRVRNRPAEDWADFLSELKVNPTAGVFGANLWRVGLVPDMGEDPWERLEANLIAVQQISRPSRPTASLDERFTSAGMQEGPWRGALRAFCDSVGARIATPRLWCREIADARPELSFDTWLFAETVAEDLIALEIAPFVDGSGHIDTSSKLKLGADGQPILEVPDTGIGSMVVKWTTSPPKVAAVVRWQLDVQLPSDLRNGDTEPIASSTVKGDKRRCTIKVSVDEDSLAAGSRFVVTLSALGEHGERVSFVDGNEAVAESQEFEIVTGAEPPDRPRRTAAASLPEAVLRAALDGLDDLSEDNVAWDLGGQVFGVRLGNRRALQIRVSRVLVDAQRRLLGAHEDGCYLSASAAYGTALEADALVEHVVALPTSLRKARSEFLQAVSAAAPRDTGESMRWTPELRGLAQTYVASYRRALDATEAKPDALLLTDTLSLDVRRSNQTIAGVVLLPLHPLRLAWIAEHDDVMRQWAAQLTDVSPRTARGFMVDQALAARVVPANLPFTSLRPDNQLALYAEELTYGAGLYLVPGGVDSEAAAEACHSVLSLDRIGSTLSASSDMVAERIRAYEESHDPSGTLRVLSLHPGSGELIAGAISERLSADDSDETSDEGGAGQRRIECVCYTDSASFVSPIPALVDLQKAVRSNESFRLHSHLFPAMALTVRPVDRLLEDEGSAHLALLQDLGSPDQGTSAPAERSASFHDLLVPLVTSTYDRMGDLVWESVPATGTRGGKSDWDLSSVHRSHQKAIARCTGEASDQVPSVRVLLDGDQLARIRTAHDRADWVVSVDKFIGVGLFEAGQSSALGQSFILDYAPDFVEGIGDRLTVTTSHKEEVFGLLEGAMTDLGLQEVETSVGQVLTTLAVVSGRLALRLLGDTTRAREAVALAAVIAHLRARGDLEGAIVIPVDAHPEIFGPAQRGDADTARRCDLLIVKVGQRSFKIDCVEVKYRQEARLPNILAQQIVDQVTDTRSLLISRFFASDPPRIDRDLQRARLGSLLHYYADRAVAHGMIAETRIADTHRWIDRVEDTGEDAEIALKGFVISLEGDRGFAKKYGDVALTVLTSDDLGQVGFTVAAQSSTGDGGEGTQSGTDSNVPGVVDPTPSDPMPPEGPSVSELTPASEDEDRGGHKEPPRDAGSTASRQRETTAEVPDVVEAHLGVSDGGSDVFWRVGTKGSPHAFIIGIPGQGKSVTTRKIVRDFADQALPSMIFDFHGDMAGNPPEGALVLNASAGLPFSPFDPDLVPGRQINITAWEIAEVIGYVAQLGTIQQTHVYKALQSAYEACGWLGTQPGDRVPTMEEFAAAVEAVEAGAKGRNARDRLRPFTDFGLFAPDASGAFRILGDARSIVIDVSSVGLEEVQRFAASFLLRRIYREMFSWGQADRLRLAVVLDEAHRLASDVTLPKIMKEGRKYGVSVVVASQSADDFHDDVLGNAGAKIVFRTNFPASKGVAGFLRGRQGVDLSKEIERLPVGVAYVSTPDEAQARRVHMDP